MEVVPFIMQFLRNVSKTPKQLTVVNGKSTAVS